MSFFRRRKRPRYPGRSPLPMVRRRVPMRYHMRHQFGVRDLAFLQTMHALTGAALSEGNRVDVLKNGVQIFPSMLAAIRAAQKTINLEFYIYWDGEVGKIFAQALAERARAGVLVNVILDAVGSATMSPELVEFLQRNGVRVEWFHPLRWYTLSRVNHRTHRKLLIVDGTVGFSGGVGIADNWLGDADSHEHWRETMVRVEGPVVTQMQFAFMDNWVKSRGELLTGLDYFPRIEPRGTQLTQVVKSSPSEGSSAVKLLYIVSIVSATRSIYISNAYFVPDRDTIRALEGAVRRGVDVRVIVPGESTDVPVARHAGRLFYAQLLLRGIRIFEYQPTMMHAKTMVVDGVWTTIGSSNFDDRSFRLNDEVNVNVHDEGVAAQMEQMFFEDLARSEEITPPRWIRRPWLDRVKERMAGWLKPQL
ncbi:MAG: cardiolipin synthase [Acidobacteria bacterium]|nr:cardiolipin synthase [Acidobacteriota bacterium]MBV9475695.1 cardiolipin synthase [Acidobacteriota bacterium]